MNISPTGGSVPDSSATSEQRQVALFPLGLVQFPTFPLELQVFESRYLTMLSDLRRRGEKEFGVITIRSGFEVGEGNVHALAEVGCMVRVERTHPEGSRVLLKAIGTWRFGSIEPLEHSRAYATARVRRLIEDPYGADAEETARLRSALLAYADTAGVALRTLPVDAEELTWWAAAGGPLTEAEQLQALAAPLGERIRLLIGWLRRETALLRSTHSLPFRSERTPPTN